MFLQNYYNIYSGTIVNNQASFSIIKPDGTSANALCGPSYNFQFAAPYVSSMSNMGMRGSLLFITNGAKTFYNNYASTSTPVFGLVLGDGNTPPTLSDYWLSGNQITDFTATSSVSSATDAGKITAIGTYTITNTGASDITIKEVGMLVTNTFSSPSFNYLIMRDVLDTPLTIAAGDTAELVYRITVTQ